MSRFNLNIVFFSLFSLLMSLFAHSAEAAKYGFLFVPSTANEAAVIDIRSGGKNKVHSNNNPFQATVKNFQGETLVDSSSNPIILETTGKLRDNRVRVIVPSIVEDCSASVILGITGGTIVDEQEVPLVIKVNPLDSSGVQNSGIICSEDPNNIPILEPLTLDETLVLKGAPPITFMDSTGNADLTLAGPIPSSGIDFNLPVEQSTCNLLCDQNETVENFTLTGSTTIDGDSLKITTTNGYMLTVSLTNGGTMVSADSQNIDLMASSGAMTIVSNTLSQSSTADSTIQSTAGDLFLKAPAGAVDVEMVSMNLVSSDGPYDIAVNNNGNYSVSTGGTVDISGGTTMLSASSAGLTFSAATDLAASATNDIILESGDNVILKKPANANVVELALQAAPTSNSIISVPVDATGSIPLVGASSQMITVGAGTSYALDPYVSDLEVTDGAGTTINQFTSASYSGQVIAVTVAAGSANITFTHSGCTADNLSLDGAANFVAAAGEAVILRRMTFPAECWVEIGRI